MNDAVYYWHPASGEVTHISPSWPESARTAQAALLTAHGYLRVIDYQHLKTQMPFARVSESFRACGDDTAEQIITETPRPIKLNRDKILRHPVIVRNLQVLMDSLTADQELATWWSTDMRYLRGSPVAKKAMAAFDLTQEQMEKIVLECKD